MIIRILQKKIEEEIFKGKIVIIYGARQVGKTTLVKQILEKYGKDGAYFNCEVLSVQEALSGPEPKRIKDFLGDSKLIVLDEAQRIANIGLILKVLIDEYPGLQIIATGSSSFDLANKINEPLTGRATIFKLFPFSLEEIKGGSGLIRVEESLDRILRFGSYPEIFISGEERARERLEQMVSNYLFKDVLIFEGVKKSGVIVKLLQSLALQIGHEVSYSELAGKLGINRITVEKYIDILEQCFIVFRLNSFSRNLRNELSKSVKVYFFDLGIRNALINNFNPLESRSDAGQIWENFCIAERLKHNHYRGVYSNMYFWRTYSQKEIDYIEERDGKLFAYEFKLAGEKEKKPATFLEAYKNSEFETVSRKNYSGFLIQQ
ncbi:MAG: ATP-binding protein [Candidatus Paceibacterota bacterium]